MQCIIDELHMRMQYRLNQNIRKRYVVKIDKEVDKNRIESYYPQQIWLCRKKSAQPDESFA